VLSPDLFTWLNLIKTVGLPWADYCHFLSSTAIFTLHYAGKLALPLVILMAEIFCNQIQHRKWSIFIIGFSLFSLLQLLRYTWSLMLLPLLLLNFGKVTRRS